MNKKPVWGEEVREGDDALSTLCGLDAEMVALKAENAKLADIVKDRDEAIHYLQDALEHRAAENAKLRARFCEAHLEECPSSPVCPCCEAAREQDMRLAREAENAKLTAELDDIKTAIEAQDENFAFVWKDATGKDWEP